MLISFQSGKLSSICKTSYNFHYCLLALLKNITFSQFSSTCAVKFFIRKNHSFLVFTISIEGRSDGAERDRGDCLWCLTLGLCLIVCGHGVRWPASKHCIITVRWGILPVAGSQIRHVIVRIPRVTCHCAPVWWPGQGQIKTKVELNVNNISIRSITWCLL